MRETGPSELYEGCLRVFPARPLRAFSASRFSPLRIYSLASLLQAYIYWSSILYVYACGRIVSGAISSSAIGVAYSPCECRRETLTCLSLSRYLSRSMPRVLAPPLDCRSSSPCRSFSTTANHALTCNVISYMPEMRATRSLLRRKHAEHRQRGRSDATRRSRQPLRDAPRRYLANRHCHTLVIGGYKYAKYNRTE